MQIIQIARAAHEVNAAYCLSIGDDSQPGWNEAPSGKGTAPWPVCSIASITPTDSHNSWLKQKAEDGWSYGSVKDPELKKHPCFLPYEQLPPHQKTKDYLFQAVVDALSPYLIE